MEHTPSLPFLADTLLFLTLAGILIPLLQRFRLNAVLGFLVAGIALGPHAMGRLAEQWPWLRPFAFTRIEHVQSFGELGVVFLMFLIGLELSTERLWAMRRWVFLGGNAQILLCALVIGLLAWAFGNPPATALVLGLVLALSSTAVVMQMLSQRHALASTLGQAAFAILMMQDIAVVPLLVLAGLLGQQSADGVASALGFAAIKSVVAILAIYLVGRRLLGPLFRFFAQHRQPEVFMALTLLVALGIAGLTSAVGLSLALGAFLAGLLMAETEYRHEVEVTMEPFKGLLMGLFFMSVGMGIDLVEVARYPGWVLASVAGLMAIKATITAGVLRGAGLSWGRSVEGGLLLSQGGEFAFVVVGVAAAGGLLGRETAQFMLLVVSLSLMLTPAVGKLGQQLRRRLDRGEDPVVAADMPGADPLSGHIVVAGFGRVGQLLADVLEQQGVRYLAVEHDARKAASLRKAGKPVFYGNAARAELLAKLHTQEAAALLVTMDQPSAAMHTVRSARALYPHLPIYARSRDEVHARALRAAGATGAVPETLEAGLQLTEFALRAVDVPGQEIVRVLDAEREART